MNSTNFQDATGLSAAKLELLAYLLEEEESQDRQARAIPVRQHAGAPPLSFAQQRLWFLDQMDPGGAVYNIPAVIRLSGTLDVATLERSLNEIIRRHEILRTTFSTIESQPVQIIASDVSLKLPVADLRSLPETERVAEAHRLAVQAIQQPFGLRQGPLLRAGLLRLGDQDHILILTMHHIISDGWSIGVFIREMAQLYEAFSDGQPSPLPELPLQYADYAVWQRQWLQGEVLQAQLAYWQQQLADAPPVLHLPGDRTRPLIQSFRGAKHSVTLSNTMAESLNALSRREGVTLFMTLLAAFQTLLYRYTGQEDIVVGSPIANRTRTDIEGLIGFFVNTLVLRTDLSGNPTFRDVLRRVREVALGAYEHQDLPFEMLVEKLNPERNLSHTPLFQVMFILQNAPQQPLEPPSLILQLLPVDAKVAKFDLTLYMVETAQGLLAQFEYSADLFDATTIARMAGHFQSLLQGMVANPGQRLAVLPLLTANERHQLLVMWNGPRADYPHDQIIHGLFETQVARTPEAVAVMCDGEQLTYQELNRRANQLAHYLQKLGVGPEVLVGICVERSLDMMVGLLGILKAGGAYVPLDPAYPLERLEYMLADAQVRVLLTQARLANNGRWQALQPLPAVVCLDTGWEAIACESGTNPTSGATPDNLAYMLYTSGSTGAPKGVLGNHRDTLNCFYWMWEAYPFECDETCCQKTPLSFGDSIQEVFGPLLHGVPTVIIPDWILKDASRLVETLAAYNVTRIVLVPSLLRVLLNTYVDLQSRLPRLKWWVASGEALPVELARNFLECMPQSLLINLYGCSEASNDVTWYPVSAETAALTTLPIGRPIANIEVYLLDRHLNPVPIGVPGELHIGGRGLVRGYHDRPELTAEKFIPNPFNVQQAHNKSNGLPSAFSEQGTRLYKTGDLARYLPDGNIEFLGRADHQLKIRGFRIELGEIEAALGQHRSVKETAVKAWEKAPGEKQLVAYMVPGQEPAPTPRELRNFLQEKLPDHMIPSAFVTLDALPLTPSGKVNRRALPLPEQIRPQLPEALVAPRTPIEELLVEIWAQVLGVSHIGIYDNFFELGGHSLLATQVVSRVRAAFQIDLPLRRLFEVPTIAGLAESIDNMLHGAKGREALPIQPVPRDRELPLSFSQQRQWVLAQLAPNTPTYTIPIALRLQGAVDVAVLAQILNEIVRRHEVLRTTFSMVDGQPVQVIAPTLTVDLPVADLRQWPPSAREAEAGRLVADETRQPFNLDRHPLFRARLLRLADEDHMLILTMPHIVADGWSIGVLFKEMATLSEALLAGQPSPLPELAIQYADFAYWQRQWLQGEALEAQLAYWKQQLNGAPAVLALPTDRPRPPIQNFCGASEPLTLSPALTREIENLGLREGVTVFMTLVAAFKVLLYRYTGQEDIVVGSFIANRNRAELENLIGFFLNTLALRTDLSGNPTFRELLARMREVSLGAYAHQDIPFEKLLEELEPERALSHTPLFQVGVNLVNVPMPDIQLPGLTISSMPPAEETVIGAAQLDLALNLRRLEPGQGLSGSMVYDTTLFDAATITRMLHHFQVLLESIVANPEQRIAQLKLLTEADRHQLLVAWDETQAPYSSSVPVHRLFETQVEQTPAATAVVYADKQLTYGELNARANQLAHYLRTLGIGPEIAVGICMERSPDMIVALLGILKVGGAYVPLDPNYPPERLAFTVRDSRAAVLLADQELAQRLADHEATVVDLDTAWETIAQQSHENPGCAVTTQNSAYVIYTSGSTGGAKGVIIQHDALVNYVETAGDEYALGPGDRVLQFASISFDTSVEEIFPCLIRGATLVLRTRSMLDSAATFLQKCRDWSLTVLDLPTAYWHELTARMSADGLELPPDVRLVIIGGTRLAERLCAWQEQVTGDVRLVNSYGPTEATVVATMCELSGVEPVNGTFREVPIGKAIRNVAAYVLDAALEPAPVGVAGELYLGGPGLARGYFQHPELTAERFVPNPFSDAPGDRLYRTGDRARYRADGMLEFLGRFDQQVKLRGFRIELGEVETVLRQHPAVQEAVAVVHSDRPSDPQLVAYVVLEPTHAITEHDLRGYVAQHLPGYMVPATVVQLDALPRTPNGKLDRRALPALQAHPILDNAYLAPRTPLEAALVAIWAEVLGVPQVGVDAHFFALGGHSLLATRLVHRVNQAFKIDLPLRRFYEAPTVADLAIAVEEILLEEIEQLSEDEAEQLLEQEG